MSNTSKFRATIVQHYAGYCQTLATDLNAYDPKDKEDFPLVIESALRAGMEIKDIADMAMTPVYNVKRWMNGTHCPPLLVRKTVTENVSKSLRDSSTAMFGSGSLVVEL